MKVDTDTSALPAQQLDFKQAILAETEAIQVSDLFCSRADGSPALLHIYRQAYGARLNEALKSNYPMLYRLLGDELFDTLAQHYIAQHPSRHPSIRWFGHVLADFLQQQPDLLPHPALGDLARMEWAICCSFDAADAPFLSVDDLLKLSAEQWPTLRCQPHPAVRRVPLLWEIEATWKALSADEEGQTPEPTSRAHTLLVWRAGKTGLETLWRSLDDIEAELLGAFLEGAPFAQLCALAAERGDAEHAAQTAAGLLRRWVEEGLFQPLA